MTREEHDNFLKDFQLEFGNEPHTQASLDKLWDDLLEYVRLTGHDMTLEELIGNYGETFKRFVGEEIRDKAKKWIRQNNLGPTEARESMIECEKIITEKGFL